MKDYLDINTLAERLQIKRSTLYAWAAQGTIPHLKLGRLVRFDPDEIDAWLHDRQRHTPPTYASHRRRPGREHVDDLIARAKHAVYTPIRGKPDQDRATRKEENHGSV
jgi:excisionase family DNA binding protein